MTTITKHDENFFSLDGRLIPKGYRVVAGDKSLKLVNINEQRQWIADLIIKELSVDGKKVTDFSSKQDFINALQEVVFRKGGGNGTGVASGAGDTASTAKQALVLFDGKLAGKQSHTFTEDLNGYHSFVINGNFAGTDSSGIMPIKTTKNFAIMTPMTSWFDTSSKLGVIGSFQLSYNNKTKTIKVVKVLFRKSPDFDKANSRDSTATHRKYYYITRIVAI